MSKALYQSFQDHAIYLAQLVEGQLPAEVIAHQYAVAIDLVVSDANLQLTARWEIPSEAYTIYKSELVPIPNVVRLKQLAFGPPSLTLTLMQIIALLQVSLDESSANGVLMTPNERIQWALRQAWLNFVARADTSAHGLNLAYLSVSYSDAFAPVKTEDLDHLHLL